MLILKWIQWIHMGKTNMVSSINEFKLCIYDLSSFIIRWINQAFVLKMVTGAFKKTLKAFSKRLYLVMYLITGFFMLSNNLQAQPFQIGHQSISFRDPSRHNRKIPVKIYYPADKAGDNAPFTTKNAFKFPSICFGHGYLMSISAYQYIVDSLVTYGYVIALPKTEEELFPSHMDLAKDISFVLKKMSESSGDSSSMFYNRLTRMSCAMGHSMGGGSAILAARSDSSIRSLAILAPADTRPSSVKAAASLDIPSLIFSGENDCITRPETDQIPIYKSLKSRSKTMITIKGGSHCQMAERNFPCNLGEAICIHNPAISRKTQHAIIIKYLLLWLDYQLKGDPTAADRFNKSIDSDTNIVVERNEQLIF